MFSERRVVLVRDVLALTGDAEALETYAAEPPESSHLVVRAPKLDRKRKLHQVLSRAGTVLLFEQGSQREQERETVGMASERGLILEKDAAGFLLHLCNGDLHSVASELEKIRCWLGDSGNAKVSRDTVRELAAASGLLSGWEVANAVLLRDTAGALAAARKLVETGEEPIKIVGGLAWRARSMLQAKAMLDARVPVRDVITAVRAWPYESSLLQGLRLYSVAELLAFPSRLLEADRDLKSTSLPPAGVLESLVRDLTRAPSGTSARTS
jgi:DNA polymerase-3 subunit delta